MTGADDRLKALFAEDEPSARDPAFSAAVIEAVARRRFLGDMALLGSAATAGGFLLWTLWEPIAPLLTALSAGLAPVAGGLAAAAAAVAILDGRLVRSPRWNHD